MKALVLSLMFVLAAPAMATRSEMRTLINATNGNIYAGHVPAGYRSVKLTNAVAERGLSAFLAKTTKQKKKDWRNYVFTSGEFDHVSATERRQIAGNPLAELEVASLLEIEEIYAIYEGNELIGYYIEVTDYVQSAIYQDGAWYEVFTDENFKIVEAYDRSA